MPIAVEWKTNKWIAALLGFFFPPLGMLYLARVSWALFYFFISLILAAPELFGFSLASYLWLLLPLICAIHCYWLASHPAILSSRPWYSHWYGLAAIVVMLYGGVFLFRAFLYEPFHAASGAMEPLLPSGTFLLVKKLGYGNYTTYGISILKTRQSAPLERGDLVVFQNPDNPAVSYVKRVIGLPGDVITYQNKQLSVNGVPVVTKLLSETMGQQLIEETLDKTTYPTKIDRNRPADDFHVTVPTGQFFVLGDNRDNSKDSRHYGPVPDDNIIGKVVYFVSPTNQFAKRILFWQGGGL